MSPSGPLLPVASMWYGDELPALARISMRSFLAHGHAYRLYVWRDYPNIPQGVEVCDANSILPEKHIYFCGEKGKGRWITPFSNWFRWELLSQERCWWIDTDFICLRPFDLPDKFVACLQDRGHKHPSDADWKKAIGEYEKLPTSKLPMANNAVIKNSDLRNPVIRAMRTLCRHPRLYTKYGKIAPEDRTRKQQRAYAEALSRWEKIPLWWNTHLQTGRAAERDRGHRIRGERRLTGGPQFTELISTMNAWSGIKPASMFYPVSWEDWHTLLDDTYADAADPFPHAYGVHLWNLKIEQAIHQGKREKEKFYTPNSFYGRVVQRYMDDE